VNDERLLAAIHRGLRGRRPDLKLYIENDDIVGDDLREPFAELVAVHRQHQARGYEQTPETAKSRQLACSSTDGSTKADLLALALSGQGSSKTAMVELKGIEPLTSSMPWKRSAN
jgi:hypothetical protein